MRRYFRIVMFALLCATVNAAAHVQTAPPAAAKKSPPAAKAPMAKAAGGFDSALLHPATLRAKAPAEYDVKFVTTAGDFTIKVTRAWAPNGADRFYNLVQHHFY